MCLVADCHAENDFCFHVNAADFGTKGQTTWLAKVTASYP
jgi:hypothetical protein